jgi:hypothetical protein
MSSIDCSLAKNVDATNTPASLIHTSQAPTSSAQSNLSEKYETTLNIVVGKNNDNLIDLQYERYDIQEFECLSFRYGPFTVDAAAHVFNT